MNKIIYLDAAASALKPESVINAEMDFLRNKYANAGRGICVRASAVDAMVDAARMRIAKFINAADSNQIVFTSGTTDGMNRIPRMLLSTRGSDCFSNVIVSDLDHHSARMPWEGMQEIIMDPKSFKVAPLDTDFNIDISNIDISVKRTDLNVLVITAMSNVLGMPQDVKKIIAMARAKNPKVITVVDAAQYAAHLPIDVTDWDCDFLCFSGHKLGADTGIGIMYIRDPKKWSPDKLGGGMVSSITGTSMVNSNWKYEAAPHKFEAGTLPLTQIAGLIPAIDELEKSLGNNDLIKYLYDELSKIDKIKIITKRDACILSFVVDGMHVLDFGALMGAHDVCIRVGNMCASWIHQYLGLNGTVRLSPGPWNTMDEMATVVSIIKKIVK